ncbi:MAG: deoxyribonuclease IV [Gemmatimonadota bacterium]
MPALPRFGAHQSIAGGLHTAVLRGYLAGCELLQVFTGPSQQWRVPPLAAAEVDWYLAHAECLGIPVVAAHASYLINLASPDRALARRSYLAFRAEVQRCDLLRIPHLVFHPGAHMGAGLEAGLQRVADHLDRVCDDLPESATTLCLESTAGAGTTIGSRFEELAHLLDRVRHRRRLGVCLDTCHLFAAGYPLGRAGEYHATMRRFAAVVGFHRLRLLHLNDSAGACGSRRDRHAHIGGGRIGRRGFRHLVTDPRLRSIPMLIETPKGDDLAADRANLRVLRSLARRLPR